MLARPNRCSEPLRWTAQKLTSRHRHPSQPESRNDEIEILRPVTQEIIMFSTFKQHLESQLTGIRSAGTYKGERVIITPQGTTIRVADGKPVLNLCANNYLGLAQHPAVAAAAKAAIDQWGYGMASVRFICGTQGVHKQLEAKISEFLGTEDTILYSSCFDANGGLFETLLGPEDAVISDELNHASIIDGIRLCKGQRLRYLNNNMDDLDAKLSEAAGARFRLVATDGVFPWMGISPTCPRSATSPRNTAHWSWWTTRTRSASWGGTGGARRSTTA